MSLLSIAASLHRIIDICKKAPRCRHNNRANDRSEKWQRNGARSLDFCAEVAPGMLPKRPFAFVESPMNLCRGGSLFTTGHFAEEGKECNSGVLGKRLPGLAGRDVKLVLLAVRERFVSGAGERRCDANCSHASKTSVQMKFVSRDKSCGNVSIKSYKRRRPRSDARVLQNFAKLIAAYDATTCRAAKYFEQDFLSDSFSFVFQDLLD